MEYFIYWDILYIPTDKCWYYRIDETEAYKDETIIKNAVFSTDVTKFQALRNVNVSYCSILINILLHQRCQVLKKHAWS